MANRRLARKIGKVPRIKKANKSSIRKKPQSVSRLYKRENAEFKIARKTIERGTTKVLTSIAKFAFAPKKVTSYTPVITKKTSFKTYRDSYKPPASAKTPKAIENFYNKLYEQYTRVYKKDSISGRKWYGPYPNKLNERNIIDISLSPKGKNLLLLQLSIADRDIYVYAITQAMRKLHNRILTYAKEQIERLVPRDTNTLRKSLIKSLYISKLTGSTVPREHNLMVNNLKLKIRLFSDLKYAGIVNNMPNKVLQHPHNVQGTLAKGRQGNVLNDPNAIKGFFSMIILRIKNEIKGTFRTEFYNNINKHIQKLNDEQIKILTTERHALEMIIRGNNVTYQESRAARKLQIPIEKELRRLEAIKASPLKHINWLFKIII